MSTNVYCLSINEGAQKKADNIRPRRPPNLAYNIGLIFSLLKTTNTIANIDKNGIEGRAISGCVRISNAIHKPNHKECRMDGFLRTRYNVKKTKGRTDKLKNSAKAPRTYTVIA